jgi:hypothetical protein
VQCFGLEASNKAKEILNKNKVALQADPTQGERDKYNRLLRYVWLEDGTFFNKMMISEGYAFEYTYNTPYKYQSEFKQAEMEARIAKKGLWSDEACNARKETKKENLYPINTTDNLNINKYNCSSNIYSCPNFKTHKEAQEVFEYCGGVKNDIHQLDLDKDGIACENLP